MKISNLHIGLFSTAIPLYFLLAWVVVNTIYELRSDALSAFYKATFFYPLHSHSAYQALLLIGLCIVAIIYIGRALDRSTSWMPKILLLSTLIANVAMGALLLWGMM